MNLPHTYVDLKRKHCLWLASSQGHYFQLRRSWQKKTDSGIILIEEEAESTEVESTQSSKSSIIQDDGEVTKEDSGIIIVDKETKGAEEDPPQSAETSIIVASDLLPTSLIIVPLFDRPFFPK